MKTLTSIFILLLTAGITSAQIEIKEPEKDPGPDPAKILYEGKDTMHQLYLDEEVEKIIEIKYEKSGKKVKGSLSDDGKRILIENYVPGSRVNATLKLANGETKEISRSSCYIDPVVPVI